MQVFKERTAIAKKVETVQVVPVIESIFDEESQILSPGQLDKILPQFAQLVSSAAGTEAITRSRLHELLHQSIDDILDEDRCSAVANWTLNFVLLRVTLGCASTVANPIDQVGLLRAKYLIGYL
jgi:hypothetical protein